MLSVVESNVTVGTVSVEPLTVQVYVLKNVPRLAGFDWDVAGLMLPLLAVKLPFVKTRSWTPCVLPCQFGMAMLLIVIEAMFVFSVWFVL